MKLRKLAVSILREPLAHFLMAGMVVFVLLSGRPPDLAERRIVVSEAVVSRLVGRWTQAFRRTPTQHEIDGLIRDHVSDQVYYRVALRLGLDRDDEVVIRRMRTKVLAIAVAQAEAAIPADSDLQDWLTANAQRYAPEPRLDFEQIYLGADSRISRALARSLLSRLAAGKPASGRLPPAPLDAAFQDATSSDIDAQFGAEFAQTIGALPQGEWQGPVPSGLGLHLVKVLANRTPETPPLVQVRQRVENDWRAAALKRAEEEYFREMLQGYDVVIERPTQ